MFNNKRNKKSKFIAEPRNLIVKTHPKSPVSEQYRTIRTNIIYSAIDHPVQKVIFTSAAPGAGKSTTAANVALAFAQTGKRTILIDADLRRPTIHYSFETTNNTGLSTLIVSDLSLNEIVKKTSDENLDLIMAGPIPPNPAELLQSKKMQNLLILLAEHYDHIIIDTPPVLSVTDTSILSRFVDGVVLVTNVQANNRDELKKAKESLTNSKANIIGIVLNNKKINTNESYYYYYNDQN
ncbi:CpsD/CapB family tyrosine-protein kinase [Macrococcus carouselicus]|uniref:non-specific protein-tyrosine kinase n=1 Tax=Macrococcus carouselicus TaxID=69969 RepID=A0A9Q8CIU8_9STAP|nr:CpsD/CapB family tyrosine-protein kinase [Macrococcus carouselicus]TDM03843.1 polysaccharide biosynthesis tyrosine autokinase [Macrococcus carouselicus]